MERIGIYGGTFSPVHSGHVNAAAMFLKKIPIDRLYIIPTAIPPHKAEVVGASAADRLEMAKLAFGKLGDRVEVSDWEIRRSGKSYTVYTLEHFTAPDRQIFLLVGTDMFLTLDGWYRPEDIFRLADIVLMRREKDCGGEIEEKAEEYRRRFGARLHFLGGEAVELSSTGIREKITESVPDNDVIPPEVVQYIEKKGLYR